MSLNRVAIFQEAFAKYLHEREADALEPLGTALEFDKSFADAYEICIFSRVSIVYERMELTNVFNRWHSLLKSWHAWNRVANEYESKLAASIFKECTWPIAHLCLFQPSRVRDAICAVATNAAHQLLLASDPKYVDQLESDPHPTKSHKAPFLTRTQAEAQLLRLLNQLDRSNVGLSISLEKIDTEIYRGATGDYRNLASHNLAPHIETGSSQLVRRIVLPSKEAVEFSENQISLVPNRKGYFPVEYEFGGVDPLGSETAFALSLEQYHAARLCFVEYLEVLRHGLLQVFNDGSN